MLESSVAFVHAMGRLGLSHCRSACVCFTQHACVATSAGPWSRGKVAGPGMQQALGAHPHFTRWVEGAALVSDGVAFARARQQGKRGPVAAAAVPARAGDDSEDDSGGGDEGASGGGGSGGGRRREKREESSKKEKKRGRSSSKRKGKGKGGEGLSEPLAAAEQPAPAAVAPAPAAGTASAGGGRWVHVPT
jgi:hypothetical protein